MGEAEFREIAELARRIMLEESAKYGRDGQLLPGAIAKFDRCGRLIYEAD